jgi:AcrR family transcriptional regulator
MNGAPVKPVPYSRRGVISAEPPLRSRLTRERVLQEALAVLDEEGLDALTTRNITQRLGVTQPAIYSHVSTLAELRAAVAERGAVELSALVRDAVGDSEGLEALRRMAYAYRDYVRRHPDRYLVQMSCPPTRETRAAVERAADAVRDVLRTFGLDEADVVRAHVSFRSAVHGFAHLEASGAVAAREKRRRDADFDFFIELFGAGLAAIGAPGRHPNGPRPA